MNTVFHLIEIRLIQINSSAIENGWCWLCMLAFHMLSFSSVISIPPETVSQVLSWDGKDSIPVALRSEPSKSNLGVMGSSLTGGELFSTS